MDCYNMLLYFLCSPGVRPLQKVKKEITMAAKLLLYNYCILDKLNYIWPISSWSKHLHFASFPALPALRAWSLGSFGMTILFQESELPPYYTNEYPSSTALLFRSERNLWKWNQVSGKTLRIQRNHWSPHINFLIQGEILMRETHFFHLGNVAHQHCSMSVFITGTSNSILPAVFKI